MKHQSINQPPLLQQHVHFGPCCIYYVLGRFADSLLTKTLLAVVYYKTVNGWHSHASHHCQWLVLRKLVMKWRKKLHEMEERWTGKQRLQSLTSR